MDPMTVIELQPDQIQALKWVYKAASKDESRPVMQCVHIEPNRMTACDSFRIHEWTWGRMMENPFPEGFYTIKAIARRMVILAKMKDAEKWPDLDAIMSPFDKYGMRSMKGKAIVNARVQPRYLTEACAGRFAMRMELNNMILRVTHEKFLGNDWTLKAYIMCMHLGESDEGSNYLKVVPA